MFLDKVVYYQVIFKYGYHNSSSNKVQGMIWIIGWHSLLCRFAQFFPVLLSADYYDDEKELKTNTINQERKYKSALLNINILVYIILTERKLFQ